MTKNEADFLNEVAAELVSRGITNPTEEQMIDAMKFRLERQHELYDRLFPKPLYSVTGSAREFIDGMATIAYNRIRQ